MLPVVHPHFGGRLAAAVAAPAVLAVKAGAGVALLPVLGTVAAVAVGAGALAVGVKYLADKADGK